MRLILPVTSLPLCDKILPMSHLVAAIAFDGMHPFELAVACEVFGLDRPELGVEWYRFRVCGLTPGPLRTSGGFTMETAYGLEALRRADTIVIPAWADTNVEPEADLLDALRRAHKRGARLMSFCSGAFVLAATGLLDGQRAATHWMYAEKLAARYPAIDVDPSVLYIDGGQILTSAGTAAGIDLCLHVVRQDYGAEIANMVARRMVVPPHRDGGQAQFVTAPVDACGENEPLHAVLGWALEHLEQDVSVDDLAERAHMSPRTFARRFRDTTGTSPYQWLLAQRILLAQRLLETTDDPVERIAEQAGFGTAVTLRHHFQQRIGTSPQAYRRTFRRTSA
jgi:AraC family transcriptional regulator, transcriptional activator FtrA